MSSKTKAREPESEIVTNTRQTKTNQQQSSRRRRGPRLLLILLSILALIALLHFIAVTHFSDSAALPSNCNELIRTTDYTQVVHLQSASQQMQAVQFVSQLTNGQPAALVQVMNNGPQSELDVYIYGCTMQQQGPKLDTLFAQQGLVQGTAGISQANTLITGELDTKLTTQDSLLGQPLQQNIYQEYAWQNSSFVQVAFPGLYPVASRGEAEQLQQQADAGQPMPWSDPLTTAELMAKDVLKWPETSPEDKVLSNDGVSAQVLLISQQPHLEVTVSLTRLVQHDNTGLWFVTGARTPGLTLSQPQTHFVTSPIIISGTGALTDGLLTATVSDHTLTPIASVDNTELSVDASGGYTGALFYTSIVPKQQGLLLVQSLPKAKSTETGLLLLMGVILE